MWLGAKWTIAHFILVYLKVIIIYFLITVRFYTRGQARSLLPSIQYLVLLLFIFKWKLGSLVII